MLTIPLKQPLRRIYPCQNCHARGNYQASKNESRAQWGLVGGKVEHSETLIAAVERECAEELGSVPEYQQLIPIEKFTSPDSAFEYHTFWCRVDSEFSPNLNHEHIGYAWIETGRWPRPLHPGLWNTVNLDTIQKKITSLERTCIR